MLSSFRVRPALDEILDQRVWIGCFPFRFKGGEAAFARIVAFVSER